MGHEFGWARGVPQTLLIHPEGRIVRYTLGFGSARADHVVAEILERI